MFAYWHHRVASICLLSSGLWLIILSLVVLGDQSQADHLARVSANLSALVSASILFALGSICLGLSWQLTLSAPPRPVPPPRHRTQ